MLIVTDFGSLHYIPGNLSYFIWIATSEKMQCMPWFGDESWYWMPSSTWDRWKLCECEISITFLLFFYYNIKYHYHIVVWPLYSGKYFFLSVVSINFIPLLNMQFYCAKDSEYNDLATIFFNTQVMLAEYNNSYYIKHFYGSWFLVFDIMTFLLQDDAIRNLFSAKTFHEYSAQSLVIFLVLYFITLFSLIYDIV